MGKLTVNIISMGLIFILLASSLYTDLKANKIKNKIVYSFMFLGLGLNSLGYGLVGIKNSILGMLLPIALLGVLYLLGAIGAGDIKLFSAVGAIMGSTYIIKIMIASFLSGGVIALYLMMIRKNTRNRLRYLIKYLKLLLINQQITPYTDMTKNKEGKFPFAIAISSGVLLVIFL